MFGFTSKAKKNAAALQAAKDLEARTRSMVANTGRTLSHSQAMRADRAAHGMESLSYSDSLELKAMGL